MKKSIAYLLSALLVGSTVFSIMHWVFHFDTTDSVMFGLIAATIERVALYLIRFLPGNKKDNSV